MKRLLARLRAAFIADAPSTDLGSLDVLDGVGTRGLFADWDDTRPVGECPPMTDEQAARLWAGIRDRRSDDTAFDAHAADALAFSNPAAERLAFGSEDYARAATWGLDLASTAEVDR